MNKKLAGLIYLFVLFTAATAQSTDFLYRGVPVFHGAMRVGCYPGTEFIFAISATGERPIVFVAENLPKGLTLHPQTGIIRGTVSEEGKYEVKVTAANTAGTSTQVLKIEIGNQLCLTPPMGWNSWNVFTKDVDETLIIEIANAMVSSGMRDLGYQYINIDDFWHALSRDSITGKPIADPVKFPSGIKYLSNYLHAQGLKLGIYSDAGTKTCGKCFGSYGFEEIDAKTYAEWGVDLLKYDFCYVPWKKKEAIARYKKMGDALKNSGRSIVYSICNWGLFKPWEWGESVGGNYWRTTPDIFDTWRGGIPFMMSTMRIIKRQNKILEYGKLGHWNDPDMLIVGNYGKGKATGRNGMFKGMTDTQYQSHMSLWAIMNAPLLASCDLRNMNDATKNILMNGELLAINQDEKGEPAQLISKQNGIWFYRKNLSDGSIAISIFNTSKREKQFELKTSALGLEGTYIARDVWQHIEAGVLKEKLTLTVKVHETVVLRLNK